jgi:hypothetical protein
MPRGVRILALMAGLLALLVLVLLLARSPARPGPRDGLGEHARTPSAAVPSLVAADLAEEEERTTGTRANPTVPVTTTAEVDEPEPPAEVPGLTVVGRAIDLDGRPVQGAELFVSDETGPAGRLVARSDESGRFRGEMSRSWGARGFLLLAEHHRAAKIEIFDLGKVELQLGTVQLEPGAEIAGRVRDEAGRVIPGARVTWLPASAFPADVATARRKGFGAGRADYAELGKLGQLRALGYGGEDGEVAPDTESAADGRFRLRGLPLGACFVVAWKKGRSYGWSAVFELGIAAANDVEIVLPPSLTEALQIAGVVRDPAGAPAAGMLVQARSRRASTVVRTAADGTFLLDEGWTQPVLLRASDEEQRWAPAELADVAPGTRTVELVLAEPTCLTVRLLDADEHPIPWGLVRVGAKRTDTGRDGTVSIPKPAEAFELEAFAPGFRTQTFGPFEPAELGDELALHLVPGQAVRGRVVAGGRPIAGARLDLAFTQAPGVTCESRNGAPLELPFQLTGRIELDGNDGTSDAAGRFLLTLHADGWHSLRVEAEGFPTSVFGPFLLAREAVAAELELELEQGGALAGKVRFAPGVVGERLVGVCNGWSFVRTGPVQEDGSYSFRDLAPGAYQVRICAPPIAALQQLFGREETREPVSWDCRVTAGATTRFDLDLSQEGSVVLAGQLALVGSGHTEWEAELLALPSDPTLSGSLRASTSLDSAGRFELRLSRAGSYRLRLGNGQAIIEQTVALVAGRNEWTCRRETGRARVQVSGAREQGRPVQLRYRVEGEDGLVFTAQYFAFWREKDSNEWVIDAPSGRGRLEFTTEPWARDARWTLVRELRIGSGEELVVSYP